MLIHQMQNPLLQEPVFLQEETAGNLKKQPTIFHFSLPKFKTFMESLNENGYYTGYTAKGWAPGVALDSLGKSHASLQEKLSIQKD